MISHKHKTIFIHIPKVAGLSIEQVFIDDLKLNYHNRTALLLGKNNNSDIGPIMLSHLTADEIVRLHFLSENLFNEYFKFAFVRHPIDRVYSFYNYFGFKILVDFESFVCNCLRKIFENEKYHYFVKPMYEYIYSGDDKLLVDYVGRYENLENDFIEVAEKLSIKKNLPHVNSSDKIILNMRITQLKRIIMEHPTTIIQNISIGRDRNKTVNNKIKTVIEELYNKDLEVFRYKL